jgi:hypothetical protein
MRQPGTKSASSPAKPERPTRADAQTHIRAGTFPLFVAQWEGRVDAETGRTWSRKGIAQACGLSKATLYRHLPQELKRHDLRL